MAVGGDDDTVAGTLPAFTGTVTPVGENELIAGRYRIMRWLGAGGMGRVYEALDTELGEKVALKVLKAGLSDDAVSRFRREVKLTRRIQHRNVARMHDIGEHNGERFLTMELIDGEPLTRRMGAQPMPWERVRALAEQICAGLAAAHEAGVVHRDLKPDNVLVETRTERAVLTDFGIARGGDDPSVTQVGSVVGTPRYMAPEQLAGRDVDARADLFSLGVMLFELLTGTRPWSGDNAISIAVAQATSAPRTIDTTATVPTWFAGIIAACLRLEASDRPASAAEVGAALREGRSVTAPATAVPLSVPSTPRARTPTSTPRMAANAPSPEPTTVAVLPMACAAGDEYLADGLFEELTDTLSTTPAIRVRPAGVARTAQPPDPRTVGRELGVDHIITGTLRRAGERLRVATRLTSVADGFQIWAHKLECGDADVLNVADELARGIAEALSTRATADTKPTDPRAVDLYLRARAELRRFWGTHAQTASNLLEQAVEIAPTSAPILGAAAYAAVQTWVMRSEPEHLPAAELALERGLASGHGEAFLASAQFHLNCNEHERAAADLARALVRAPMSAQTHELAGKMLAEIDGTGSARVHFETACGLDPSRTPIIDNDLARIDALEQRWDSAAERVQRVMGNADVSIKQLGIVANARLLTWRGQVDIMIEAARPFLTRVSPGAGSIFTLASQLYASGEVDRELWEREVLTPPKPNTPVRGYLMRLQLVTEVTLVLSKTDLALEALRVAADQGLMDRVWLENCPLLGRISATSEYAAIRAIVAERAARTLAAYRGSATRS